MCACCPSPNICMCICMLDVAHTNYYMWCVTALTQPWIVAPGDVHRKTKITRAPTKRHADGTCSKHADSKHAYVAGWVQTGTITHFTHTCPMHIAQHRPAFAAAGNDAEGTSESRSASTLGRSQDSIRSAPGEDIEPGELSRQAACAPPRWVRMDSAQHEAS